MARKRQGESEGAVRCLQIGASHVVECGVAGANPGFRQRRPGKLKDRTAREGVVNLS